ncbi:multidrug SMR transporter [Parapedobacter pyrenivorans]|uniref:Multidrug SMR transporter n=1 Tax=Parapedobacter pyrenivorans TaxID=1305674 RepID=A0A917HW35_9SPHI|nr:multidrug efflux SMR transporter [Parapedobacter pyrenivorans]GGG93947.1 multidrug SMR transporter [Parapedobacter pyrenivorans]
MKYIFLGLAIVLEVVGTSFLNASNGFSRITPTLVSIVSYVICFYFLSLAIKQIPLGIAYAIWCGLGIGLTAIVSVVVFKQKLDLAAVMGMALIGAGVVVMSLFSKSSVH